MKPTNLVIDCGLCGRPEPVFEHYDAGRFLGYYARCDSCKYTANVTDYKSQMREADNKSKPAAFD